MTKREHLQLLQQRAAEMAQRSDALRDQHQTLQTQLTATEQQLAEVEKAKHELRGGIAVLAEQLQAEEADASPKSDQPANVETIASRKAAKAKA